VVSVISVTSPRHPLHIALWVQLAAVALLVGVIVWLARVRLPVVRDELARERAARTQLEDEVRAGRLREAATRLAAEDARGKLEANASTAARADLHVPVVLFRSDRPKDTVQLTLAPDARRVVLWIDAAPHVHLPAYRLQIVPSTRGDERTLDGLLRNEEGVFAIEVPAAWLPPGGYILRISGLDRGTPTLLAEYTLRVVRP
jgi:hypothetical protein